MIFLFLQPAGRQAYARTIGPQHHRQKIVRDAQQPRPDAVLRQQQPARQPLFNIVQPIASRRLRHLQPVNRRISVEPAMQLRAR